MFRNLLPLIPLAIGSLSLALVVGGSKQQRAYRVEGHYLVSVRYPLQRHDIREFVTPGDPQVLALYRQLGPYISNCLQWVCSEVDYRRDLGEFFQFPSETLTRRLGDCEDSSNLLTSLLRNFTSCYTVLGIYQGYGHAWCEHDGVVMETTYTYARPVPDPQNYSPYIYFNEQLVVEVWPGAMRDLFEVERNEGRKLQLMAEVVE